VPSKEPFTSGAYDAQENVLHLWYERPVDLADELTIMAFFAEVETRWIRACPVKPYLLVNYRNVRIAPTMTAVYARCIQKFRPLVLGTFRYGVGADLTGVAVTMGNIELAARANIFDDEASARRAILEARRAADTHK
jgi:hypothetical protein